MTSSNQWFKLANGSTLENYYTWINLTCDTSDEEEQPLPPLELNISCPEPVCPPLVCEATVCPDPVCEGSYLSCPEVPELNCSQPICEAPIVTCPELPAISIPECPEPVCEAVNLSCPIPVCPPPIIDSSFLQNDSGLTLSQAPISSGDELETKASNKPLISTLGFLCACMIVDVVSTFFFAYYVVKKQPADREIQAPSPIRPGEYWNDDKVSVVETACPTLYPSFPCENRASEPTLEETIIVTQPDFEAPKPPIPPNPSNWNTAEKEESESEEESEYEEEDEETREESTSDSSLPHSPVVSHHSHYTQ
jgi:hypothetical protein